MLYYNCPKGEIKKEREENKMMYQIKEMKKDIAMVESMIEVVKDFSDGKEFTLSDIPEEKRRGYRPYPNWEWNKFEFTGSSLIALARRGILEIVRVEKYIYTDSHNKDRVGKKNVYRYTGVTIEEYKKVLAQLTYKAILAE